jgi:hypothetical protein
MGKNVKIYLRTRDLDATDPNLIQRMQVIILSNIYTKSLKIIVVNAIEIYNWHP